MGTSLMITDIYGTPLIQPNAGVRMCSLIRNTPRGEMICEASDRQGGHETLLSKETHVYRCLAGFIDFSAAVVFRGEVIGMLVGGQVKTGEEEEENLQEISDKTGVPVEELKLAYREMPCVEEDVLREKLPFLKNVMETLCELSGYYYEARLKDRKAVADAEARARAADEVTELFSRQLKHLSAGFTENQEPDRNYRLLQDELNEMIRQVGSVKEVIRETPDYAECSDQNYRIREVIYELQWVLNRVSAPFGERIRIHREESIPPYLCGDPDAISDVLSRILQYISRIAPGRSFSVAAGMERDSYAALIRIRIICPGCFLSEQELSKAAGVLRRERDQLFADSELEYLELVNAAVVAGKLSAELALVPSVSEEEGLCFEFAVPQLPAKGGFY